VALLAIAGTSTTFSQNTTRPQFTETGRGEGRDEDGVFFAFTAYRDADGFRLSKIHIMCPTEEGAHDYFEKRLAMAQDSLSRAKERQKRKGRR
jgi:hypothetical protein